MQMLACIIALSVVLSISPAIRRGDDEPPDGGNDSDNPFDGGSGPKVRCRQTT